MEAKRILDMTNPITDSQEAEVVKAYILTGFMTSLWHFYLFFGFILSVSMAIFQVPLTVAVTMWFRKHLGLGMGLLQSSQGIGPLVARALGDGQAGLLAFY